MRCDLHVHSVHSGPADLPVLRHVGNECYSEPLAVYERARERGMDLVTLSDHDTIDGALRLAHLPDTFVSEEVTLLLPEGRQLHVNVFDITESQHVEVQRRRGDPEALFAWLAENRIAASVNHLFSALTGERALADLHLPLGRLPLIEGLSNAMPPGHNAAAQRVGREARMSPIGGSDAHSLAHVARAFTIVPGARTKREFLQGLRDGLTIPAGSSASYARLTKEVGCVFAAGYADAARALRRGEGSLRRYAALGLLVPLLPLLPLVTLGIYAHEVAFAAAHYRAFRRSLDARTRTLFEPSIRALRLEEAA
jgi:predicted metal-dependent phosphoesterase TrpH